MLCNNPSPVSCTSGHAGRHTHGRTFEYFATEMRRMASPNCWRLSALLASAPEGMACEGRIRILP
eukprot:250955-Chlamydomonas_euryale.AAC.4